MKEGGRDKGEEVEETHTMLLIRVQTEPTNVLKATVLNLMFAGVFWKFLYV